MLSISTSISSNEQADLIGKEVAIQFEKILQKIGGHCRKYSYIDTLSSLRKIFRQISSSEKLTFFGEPLAGLQIMGMLETRAIDFDKVILLGANEGVIPAAIKPNSFLPNELKKYYGLPSNSDHDSIYAYYFYRLLQSPSEVHLVYSSASDDFGASNEKSRFISQLEFESKRKQLGYKN